MSLDQAEQYPAALSLVRERVKPMRDKNRRKTRRENWWLLGELVPAMRAALRPLSRYIAGTATGKRFLFSWANSDWCPSNAMNVFALDSDYAIGVLTSSVHEHWAALQSSTLEDRPRYTPTSCFETYPWPEIGQTQQAEIGEIGARLLVCRQNLCAEHDLGLTTLYNRADQGAYVELKDLHDELDRMVVKAYGWPASAALDPDESNRRLLELNASIAAGELAYAPFA